MFCYSELPQQMAMFPSGLLPQVCSSNWLRCSATPNVDSPARFCMFIDFPVVVFDSRTICKCGAPRFGNGPRWSSCSANPQGVLCCCQVCDGWSLIFKIVEATFAQEAMACGLSPDRFVFSNRDLSANRCDTSCKPLFLLRHRCIYMLCPQRHRPDGCAGRSVLGQSRSKRALPR